MAALEVVPFAAALGAEVRCGDVRALDDTGFAELRLASLDHLVVLIRGQELADDELVAFGRRFGDLQVSNPLPSPLAAAGAGVTQKPRDERLPEVTVVSNIVENGVAVGGLGDGELVWHSDMSSFAEPPAQTILHSIEVPGEGGDTGFLNMYAAWDALAPALRERVAQMTLKHDATIDAAGNLRRQFADEPDITRSAGSRHPLVRTHPETGHASLYLGRRAKAWLVGLDIAGSDALLDELWAHATRPEFEWRHHWRAGDMLVWDNRCTMHHRTPFDPAARRYLHRVVVKGDAPARAARASKPHPRARTTVIAG